MQGPGRLIGPGVGVHPYVGEVLAEMPFHQGADRVVEGPAVGRADDVAHRRSGLLLAFGAEQLGHGGVARGALQVGDGAVVERLELVGLQGPGGDQGRLLVVRALEGALALDDHRFLIVGVHGRSSSWARILSLRLPRAPGKGSAAGMQPGIAHPVGPG